VSTGTRVRRIAAHGLGAEPIAESPLGNEEFRDLLDASTRERIVGLLAAAIEEGALPATPSQVELVGDQHGSLMTRAVEIEAAALDAVALLEHAGIEARVLKGLATAHLDLPDPSWRTFVDADLLLSVNRFAEGARLLASAYRGRDLVERRRGFDERFAKDVTVYGPGVELDLHRTLALGAFGLAIDLEELWAGSEDFVLGGVRLVALDTPRRLLHACISAMLGDPRPRLGTLRDAAGLLARPDLDADEVVRLAAGWRCRAVLAAGVRSVAQTLAWPPAHALLDWSREYRPSAWERAMLRSYPAMGGSNALCILSGAAALAPLDAVAYVRAWVFPDRRYRAARVSTQRAGELRTGAREVTSLAAQLATRRRPAGDR
jgi:hypothetical protein